MVRIWSQPTPMWRSPSARHRSASSVVVLSRRSITTKSLPAPCILLNRNARAPRDADATDDEAASAIPVAIGGRSFYRYFGRHFGRRRGGAVFRRLAGRRFGRRGFLG